MENVWEAVPGPLRKLGPIVMSVIVVIVLISMAIASSVVNVRGDEVGIVEKKFGGGSLKSGRILAVEGEKYEII